MNRLEEMTGLLRQTSFDPQNIKVKVLSLMTVIGVLTFVISLLMGDQISAWQGLLINTVYFAGIAQAGLMFSVIATVTDAFWLRPIKRFAEGLSFFGLFSVFLFVLLFFGGSYLFEWYDHDKVAHTKEAWLNVPFFVIRQLLSFALLGLISYFYLRNSLRPDLGLAKKLNFDFIKGIFGRWGSNYQEHELEAKQAYDKNKYLAPVLGFCFSLVASLVAFDWLMSLDQLWFSTMFGVQYMVASLIGAGAILILISGYMQSRLGLGSYQTIYRHHDLAKITFAFCLLWTYMIFSQVLVIWYANVPEETPFLILRMQSTQWGWMYWVIFFMMFIIPFFGLMSRTACRSIIFTRIIAIDILIGLWLEKYFIIVPAVQQNNFSSSEGHGHSSYIAGFEWQPFLVAVLIGIGLLGIFIYSYWRFLTRSPLMVIADNRLIKQHH